MENKLTKKYGLITAICMVVGIVIGSGIFFKGQTILNATKGNVWLSALAWAIGGIVMIICASQFAVMATKYSKVNGVVDYAEETCGSRYAYYVGWFATTIYYPAMTSVLAWVSARYFGGIFGWHLWSAEVMILAGFFLVMSYVVNALSPKIAGYFQVSATIIKLIPLILMAVVGIIFGLVKGTLIDNVTGNVIILPGVLDPSAAGGSELFAAICATAFAYEGWIIATSINSEIKNAKRNLPLALFLGAIIVVVIYILYNIAICGGAPMVDLMNDAKGSPYAFTQVFGNIGGIILNVCIVVSCLGTLNGLMLGSTRGLYSISVRGEGPAPKMFSQVDSESNMPTNSAIFGLLVCALWLVYFYGANIPTYVNIELAEVGKDTFVSAMLGSTSWFGLFCFDSSELPIITIYAMYIPMLIMWIVKEKDLSVFKRFILPILAIISCLFLVFVAIWSHGVTPFLDAQAEGKFSFPVLFYLIIYAVVMGIGFLFSKDFKKLIGKK